MPLESVQRVDHLRHAVTGVVDVRNRGGVGELRTGPTIEPVVRESRELPLAIGDFDQVAREVIAVCRPSLQWVDADERDETSLCR